MEQKELIISAEGKRKLEDELQLLIKVERPKIIKQLQDARSQGDLSENADYDAAKNDQAELENKISLIQTQLKQLKVYDEESTSSKHDLISIGTIINFKRLDNKKEEQISLCGPLEVDLFSVPKKVSIYSPLGKALLENRNAASEQQEILISNIKTPYKIRVTSISNKHKNK